MLWYESVIIDGDHQVKAADLAEVELVTVTSSRRLLVHVCIEEDEGGEQSYVALMAFIVQRRADGSPQIEAIEPIVALSLDEQTTIRTWLVRRHWPAWARASAVVRTLLGEAEASISLAEAARAWMLPLSTLTTAAEQGRLPTLPGGGRRLVYASTIREAQDRGLLQPTRGRPRRMRR